jgi:type VI secretion system secreted protein Hcp
MAAYIKFEGIDGEAQDKDHKAWSDLMSFSQSMHPSRAAGTGATRRRGDVILDDIVTLQRTGQSRASRLAEAVCKGKVFPKVEVHLTASYTDAGRVTYYAYELKNAQITSYNVSGSGQSEDVPEEHFGIELRGDQSHLHRSGQCRKKQRQY